MGNLNNESLRNTIDAGEDLVDVCRLLLGHGLLQNDLNARHDSREGTIRGALYRAECSCGWKDDIPYAQVAGAGMARFRRHVNLAGVAKAYLLMDMMPELASANLPPEQKVDSEVVHTQIWGHHPDDKYPGYMQMRCSCGWADPFPFIGREREDDVRHTVWLDHIHKRTDYGRKTSGNEDSHVGT